LIQAHKLKIPRNKHAHLLILKPFIIDRLLHRTNAVPRTSASRFGNAPERCAGILTHAAAIIEVLPRNEKNTMEAEHLNSISNKLDDIAQRAAELRRYL